MIFYSIFITIIIKAWSMCMRGTVVGLCVSVCVCYQSKGCLINLRNNLSIPDDFMPISRGVN